MYLASKVQCTVIAPWKCLNHMHVTGFCSCGLKPLVGVASLPSVVVYHLLLSPVMSVGREVWDLQRLGIGLILLLVEGDPLLLITNGSNLWERRSSDGMDELWCGGCHLQNMWLPGACQAGQTHAVTPTWADNWILHTHPQLSPGDMAPAVPAKVRIWKMKSLGTKLPGLANCGKGPPHAILSFLLADR